MDRPFFLFLFISFKGHVECSILRGSIFLLMQPTFKSRFGLQLIKLE